MAMTKRSSQNPYHDKTSMRSWRLQKKDADAAKLFAEGMSPEEIATRLSRHRKVGAREVNAMIERDRRRQAGDTIRDQHDRKRRDDMTDD